MPHNPYFADPGAPITLPSHYFFSIQPPQFNAEHGIMQRLQMKEPAIFLRSSQGW
jgi:hypothetical protein